MESLRIRTSGLALAFLSAALWGSQALAQDAEAEAAAEPSEPPLWAGSSVSMRTASTVLSVARDADLTYNPVVEVSGTFSPVFQVTDFMQLGASLSLARELTNSDYTTRRGETEVSDLNVRASFPGFYTIPVAEIRLSADLPLAFPTSKISRARTMVMAVSPGISLSRRFEVLSGLTLRYGLRGTYWWHRWETGRYEQSTIPGCTSNCQQFVAMEVLNPTWRIANSFGVDLAFIDELSLGLSFAVVRDDVGRPPEADVSLVPITPTDARYSNSSSVSLTGMPIDWLAVTIGADTSYPQLRPGPGEYYTPFFNRYTVAYLDLSLDFGTLFPGRNAQ